MTFATDVNGEAEATFYLACRDNRGALSDTLVRTIPLQNFPPVINFEPDFDPRFDLQREITAENDTLYWNWGAHFQAASREPVKLDRGQNVRLKIRPAERLMRSARF